MTFILIQFISNLVKNKNNLEILNRNKYINNNNNYILKIYNNFQNIKDNYKRNMMKKYKIRENNTKINYRIYKYSTKII